MRRSWRISIDRLGARFGLRRVTRLVPQDTHIPEFAVMAVAASVPLMSRASGHAGPDGSPLIAGTSGV